LELICTREAGAVFEAGGLNCVLSFIRDNGCQVHKDTLHSAMAVVSRLCTKMEPQDPSLPTCVEALSTLLKHEDSHVSKVSFNYVIIITHSLLEGGPAYNLCITGKCVDLCALDQLLDILIKFGIQEISFVS